MTPRDELRRPLIAVGPYLWAAFLVLIVAGPWLGAGYIFGTDWPGPRRFDFPNEVGSTFIPRIAMAILAHVATAELVTKLLIWGSLFVAAAGAYRAVPVGTFLPRAAAALLYTANPYVYGRLHYGQLLYVAGYAILPWFALCLRNLQLRPSLRTSVPTAAVIALLGAADLHLLIPAGLLCMATVLSSLILGRPDIDHLVRLGQQICVTAAISVAASAYWLLPLVAGRGVDAEIVSRMGQGDLIAFRTVPDQSLGLIPNLLGLYGFWAEGTNRFPSMKLFVPGWYVALLCLLLLAAVGAFSVLRSRDPDLQTPAWWVVGLLLAGTISLLLDVGVADPHLAPIVRWIDSVLPLYRGMRDSGKWAALLAVVYAQLVPLGVIVIRDWFQRRWHGVGGDVASAVVSGLALALPLYYGNGLLFGMHGQVRPSMYPAGWYAADRVMAADPRHGRALFLPWHLYLGLSFVRNVNVVVSSPAPTFFSVPVVVSADPEVPGTMPPNDPEQTTITNLVASGDRGDWATALAALNIKYVLVAKEVDWQRFAFFGSQSQFIRVGDYGSVTLYRNTSFP